MPVLDHFKIAAPFYDRFISVMDTDRLASRLALPAQGLLLDAGGGTGRVSYALSSSVSGVIVADLSMEMLRQACAKGSLSLAQAQVELLPFPDNTFLRVIMVDAFHHVINQPLTAAELFRVLAPGGVLVIEEPDIHHWLVKAMALGEKLALMRSHFMKPETIARLFSAPNARARVEKEGWNSWVIVHKG